MNRFRRALVALALLLIAGVAVAIPISQWSVTAGNNNSGVPDGAPENWTGSQINDWGRQTMAVVRAWYDDPQWLEVTYELPSRGAKTLTKVDADTLDVVAANATAYFVAGRRIRIIGATTVTCYVASSALNGADTRIEVGTSCTVPTAPTTVNVYFGADLRSAAFDAEGSGGGLDADTVDGDHASELSAGLMDLRVVYASATTVTLARGYQQKIRVEIDGVVLEGSGDLTVNITDAADREDTAACGGSASEQLSTWYYIYVRNNSSVIEEEVSSTPPVMDPASGKVGYHPGTCNGLVGWRFVGAFWNGAADIQPFDSLGDGWFAWRTAVVAFQKSPGTGNQTTYALVSLSANVPQTARAVRLNASVQQEDAKYYYGHESLSGLTVSSNRTANYLLVDLASSDNNPSDSGQFDIPIDGTPNVAWGVVETTVEAADEHTLDIVAWRDDVGISY